MNLWHMLIIRAKINQFKRLVKMPFIKYKIVYCTNGRSYIGGVQPFEDWHTERSENVYIFGYWQWRYKNKVLFKWFRDIYK